jgi:hypothetical protein
MIENIMLIHVLDADYRGVHRVWLRFNDGAEGELDLSIELDGEVFEPLRDPDDFAQFALDKTPVWRNGADFAPEFLRSRL